MARTGIEYPMMKDLGHSFISNQREREYLVDCGVSGFILDEYMRNDAERSTNATSSYPVVYDYFEQSPYYEGENKVHGPYIDERDFIELPSPYDQSSGSIKEPYAKQYYFNPNNLPYNLEQAHGFGAQSGLPQSKVAQQRQGLAGPRLNRYYEKLKPYYRLDYTKREGDDEMGLPVDRTL